MQNLSSLEDQKRREQVNLHYTISKRDPQQATEGRPDQESIQPESKASTVSAQSVIQAASWYRPIHYLGSCTGERIECRPSDVYEILSKTVSEPVRLDYSWL